MCAMYLCADLCNTLLHAIVSPYYTIILEGHFLWGELFSDIYKFYIVYVNSGGHFSINTNPN